MLCTAAINTSNTTRTQTGAAERYSSGLDSNSCCWDVLFFLWCLSVCLFARIYLSDHVSKL